MFRIQAINPLTVGLISVLVLMTLAESVQQASKIKTFSHSIQLPGTMAVVPRDPRGELRKNQTFAVFTELSKWQSGELYAMRSMDDPCTLVPCSGLSPQAMKASIDAVLANRHITETSALAWRQLYISCCTVVISILALVVSFLAYRVKRLEGVVAPPADEKPVSAAGVR
jgi:hypothetical protein